MILEVRYYNLEDFSINKVHADKWLGYERIEKLEKIREKKNKRRTGKTCITQLVRYGVRK